MGDIKRHDHQRHAGLKHDFSGFRVDIDVEFGGGRDVAHFEIGATHQDDLFHAGHDIGGAGEGCGDIGQRAEWAERNTARRFRAKRVDDEIDRMGGLQRHGGIGQRDAIKPRFPMHMFGGDQRLHQRPVAACKDRDIGPPRQFADDARVLLRQRKRHIARDRGDAQHRNFVGAGQGQKDRHGVILAGVGVDDDLGCHVALLRILGQVSPAGQKLQCLRRGYL